MKIKLNFYFIYTEDNIMVRSGRNDPILIDFGRASGNIDFCGMDVTNVIDVMLCGLELTPRRRHLDVITVMEDYYHNRITSSGLLEHRVFIERGEIYL